MDDMIIFGEALIDDFGTRQVIGGAPFNVARHLAIFGLAPLLVSRIGVDAGGDLIAAECARCGLSDAALQRDLATPTGRVIVEHHGASHRFVILPDQAYDHIDAAPMAAAIKGKTASPLYFGTLAQRAGSRAALTELLAAHTGLRYLDLNIREGQVSERIVFDSLHQADLVKVNEDELRDLLERFTHRRPLPAVTDSEEVRAACATLLRVFTLQGLVVTLGEHGAVYYGADGSVVTSGAAPKVDVVDTVGAGDAFSAVVLLGLRRGWPLAVTMERANVFAAAVCGIAGAVPADLSFYAPWMARWSELS